MLLIIVVWLGAHKVMDNKFSLGLLLAFITYKEQFLSRVSELINKRGRSDHAPIARRTSGRHRADRLRSPRTSDVELPRPWPVAIEVRNLRFPVQRE